MKKYMLVLMMVVCFTKAFSSTASDDKQLLKKVWKIEQIYFDSLAGEVDSILINFRMIPASDSVFYLHDGRSPKLMYWNLEEGGKKIMVYQEKDFVDTPSFLEYRIDYVDDQNLILTLDISNKNLPIQQIEYRLIPDPDFFNQ